MEGRAEDEGFKIYQLKKQLTKKKLRFKKLTRDEFVELKPDSLISVEHERISLRIPKGLEIHYAEKKGAERFYRGYSRQVTRIQSDSSQVPISLNGVISSKRLEFHLSDSLADLGVRVSILTRPAV